MSDYIKCKVEGTKITPCELLTKCDREGLGDIAIGSSTRFSDHSRRMTVTIGRFQKNKIQIGYCPCCGSSVFTKHPEEVSKDA